MLTVSASTRGVQLRGFRGLFYSVNRSGISDDRFVGHVVLKSTCLGSRPSTSEWPICEHELSVCSAGNHFHSLGRFGSR
jgi:hypothetical protein